MVDRREGLLECSTGCNTFLQTIDIILKRLHSHRLKTILLRHDLNDFRQFKLLVVEIASNGTQWIEADNIFGIEPGIFDCDSFIGISEDDQIDVAPEFDIEDEGLGEAIQAVCN
jgi:hypothetical protein